MPWIIVEQDGEYCVYEEGADGEPEGESLGCHGAREEAEAQLAALYANEPEAGRAKVSIVKRLAEGLRRLAHELEQPPEVAERAVSIGQIFSQLDAAVWEMESLEGGYPWLNDLYLEEGGQPVAILSAGGKLYRAPVILDGSTASLGEMQEVEIEFAPVRARSFTITRQADGRYRWLTVACSAVLNRVGEIDSKALFDSFVENAETEGYPTLRFFHDPRMDFGQADWLAREGVLLLASGLFDEEHPLAEAMIDAAEKGRGEWGASHGFDPTAPPEMWQVADGVAIPVYQAGVLREISVLPEVHAAAWFTSMNVEVKRMRKETMDALVSLFGDEDKAQTYAEEIDQTNRAIGEAGLITREDASNEPQADDAAEDEDQEGPEAPEAGDEEPEPEAEGPEIVLDEATLRDIAGRVKAEIEGPLAELRQALAALDVPGALRPVSERVAELGREVEAQGTRLEALERDDEQKHRQWRDDMPARQRITVTHRPREANRGDGEGTSLAETAAATAANLPKY